MNNASTIAGVQRLRVTTRELNDMNTVHIKSGFQHDSIAPTEDSRWVEVGPAGEPYLTRQDFAKVVEQPPDSGFEGHSWGDKDVLRSESESKGPSLKGRMHPADQPTRVLVEECLASTDETRWRICVPRIEYQIRRLYSTLGRAPTNEELAEALGIDVTYYYEILTHLKDLEIGVLASEHLVGAEWLTFTPGSLDGDAVFRCLRSEMISLFASAIANLPPLERLVIALSFEKHQYSQEIGLTLNLPESTVDKVRASSYLHIRASLPDPHLGMKPCKRQIVTDSGSNSGFTDEPSGRPPDGDIHIRAYQTSMSSDEGPWPSPGGRWYWQRSFYSWYYVDEQQEFTQLGRDEKYSLEVTRSNDSRNCLG